MSERDEQGRYLPGHAPSSPGRPPKRHEERLAEAFRQVCDAEAMTAITTTLVRLATRGDVAAAKLIFVYAMGRPLFKLESMEAKKQTPFEALNEGRDIISRVLARVESRAASAEQSKTNGDGRHNDCSASC